MGVSVVGLMHTSHIVSHQLSTRQSLVVIAQVDHLTRGYGLVPF